LAEEQKVAGQDITVKKRLKEALGRRFPGEDVGSLAEMLSLASEQRTLCYDEVTIREDVKIDLLLLSVRERILIPLRTSKALAWEDRLLTFKPGEVYEMPHAVRYLIRNAEKTGEWDPDYAVKRYLEEIGEEDLERILAFLNIIKENIKGNRITERALLNASEEMDLKQDMGRVIAELKGGGVISPRLRNPSLLQYEVNPSLIKR